MGSAGERHLSEEAASYIRDSITSGRLAPGKYVRIDRVADALGLSATPIREALHLLRTEGFVELDPNRGFRVASMSREDIFDVFQLLAFVAGELSARTAENISDDQITALEELQKAMSVASEKRDWEEVENLNNRFHRLINCQAESPRFLAYIGLLIHYVPRRFYASIPGWPEASLTDHDIIIDAMRRRSSESARKAMANHMTHAGLLLAANLDARKAGQEPTTSEEMAASEP